MIQSSRKPYALLCFLIATSWACVSAPSKSPIPELASDDSTREAGAIELDRLVRFSDPEDNEVLLSPGRYRVEAGERETLKLIGVDGQVDVIAAEVGAHDESPQLPEALSLTTGEDEHHIVLIQPGGRTLDAAGTFSGVSRRAVGRLARRRLTRAQVAVAYSDHIQARFRRMQSVRAAATLPRATRLSEPPFFVWNRSQFDVNQVWRVHYEPVPGQDVGNKVSRLLTSDLSQAFPCGSPPGTDYDDRIRVDVPAQRDANGALKTTPYYVFEYIQERLCSPGGTHLYWGDINAPGGGGYVTAANAKPIPSKPFAPGIVDFQTRDGSDYPNQSAFRLVRETVFIFDASGYPFAHTRYEQALCGPDGRVYLYRKPYPTYFIGHESYESGPIPLSLLGSYLHGYYDDIQCGS